MQIAAFNLLQLLTKFFLLNCTTTINWQDKTFDKKGKLPCLRQASNELEAKHQIVFENLLINADQLENL